jgi:hypothetical protein
MNISPELRFNGGKRSFGRRLGLWSVSSKHVNETNTNLHKSTFRTVYRDLINRIDSFGQDPKLKEYNHERILKMRENSQTKPNWNLFVGENIF